MTPARAWTFLPPLLLGFGSLVECPLLADSRHLDVSGRLSRRGCLNGRYRPVAVVQLPEVASQDVLDVGQRPANWRLPMRPKRGPAKASVGGSGSVHEFVCATHGPVAITESVGLLGERFRPATVAIVAQARTSKHVQCDVVANGRPALEAGDKGAIGFGPISARVAAFFGEGRCPGASRDRYNTHRLDSLRQQFDDGNGDTLLLPWHPPQCC